MAILDNIKERITSVIPSRDHVSAPLANVPAGFEPDEDFDERPPYSNHTIVAHAFQMFFIFLAMCCFASVASFQAQWKIGPSFLSGFAVFVSVTGFLLSAWMLFVPFIYWRTNRLKGLARPLNETRVKYILAGAGTVWLLLISFISTISAWTEAGCKDVTNDPHASLGKDFQNGLSGWCTTKKAGAAFFWMTFAAWLGTVAIVVLEWRMDKATRPKDPPFTHPIEAVHDEDEPFDARDHDDDFHSRKMNGRDEEEATESPFRDSYAASSAPAVSRPSMDTYGAFSDPAPTGFGAPPPVAAVSRTMQYADPYAAIRTNLGVPSPTSEYPARPGLPPNPPSYDYTGYR